LPSVPALSAWRIAAPPKAWWSDAAAASKLSLRICPIEANTMNTQAISDIKSLKVSSQ